MYCGCVMLSGNANIARRRDENDRNNTLLYTGNKPSVKGGLRTSSGKSSNPPKKINGERKPGKQHKPPCAYCLPRKLKSKFIGEEINARGRWIF